MKNNWYEKTGVIILFLIFFFPVGLFLMWKYSKWGKAPKIIISVIIGLIFIASLGGNNASKTDSTATTPKTNNTKVETVKKEGKTEEQLAKEKADADAKAKVAKEAEDAKAKAAKEAEDAKAKAAAEASIPTEYKSALKKAETYSKTMHMSKSAIYDQLTSEYGEKFTAEASQYAVDNLQADYKQNALKKAQNYQEKMSMSPSAIYDQLISEYGEKFTAEEAQYAIDNLK